MTITNGRIGSVSDLVELSSVPDRVIDAPIPDDLAELYYNCVHFTPDTPMSSEAIGTLIERIARLEAEKQEAYTEGWNAAIEAACDKADFGMIAPEDVRALAKPTAAKQGDPS